MGFVTSKSSVQFQRICAIVSAIDRRDRSALMAVPRMRLVVVLTFYLGGRVCKFNLSGWGLILELTNELT
jgi:hypothetical protein